MSLPHGFLDELRTRVSLSQVVGRKVMWDQRKSNQAKGDLWAPCPFHQEKTASFHVDDRKGFYYCFGCHQKGDAISFVRETENVGFMEAVEILAREAGIAEILTASTTLADSPANVELASREGGEGSEERFEGFGPELQARMRQGFLDLAAEFPDRFRVIDGNRDMQSIAAEVLGIVLDHLA